MQHIQRDIEERLAERAPDVEVLLAEVSGGTVRLYIDHPDGVDLALCERVTNELRDYLRDYTVDVSSPGIERPLRKPQHFRNVLGRRVALRTPSRRKLRGEVVDANEKAVTVQTDNESVQVSYDDILRGNLIDEG